LGLNNFSNVLRKPMSLKTQPALLARVYGGTHGCKGKSMKGEPSTRPASSEAAKNEWRLEIDQVAQFVEDACTRDADSSEKSSEVYTQYKGWVELNGVKHAVTHKTLRDRLTLLSFGKKKKTNQGSWVVGLKLKGAFHGTDQ
jgi:phage/plasmid-associated DNA primase